MTNTKNINTDDLTENGNNLELNGKTIATKTIAQGWTKFFATSDGDGFGEIRNTGLNYYVNEAAFKSEMAAQGE